MLLLNDSSVSIEAIWLLKYQSSSAYRTRPDTLNTLQSALCKSVTCNALSDMVLDMLLTKLLRYKHVTHDCSYDLEPANASGKLLVNSSSPSMSHIDNQSHKRLCSKIAGQAINLTSRSSFHGHDSAYAPVEEKSVTQSMRYARGQSVKTSREVFQRHRVSHQPDQSPGLPIFQYLLWESLFLIEGRHHFSAQFSAHLRCVHQAHTLQKIHKPEIPR
ncbi:hypothetical protein KCU93_g387, partial [Aureobasidium melanogenum]